MSDRDHVFMTADISIDYLVQQRKNSRVSKGVQLILDRDGISYNFLIYWKQNIVI
jgi:hypothetical protein